MADLTVTAANVVGYGTTKDGVAGGTITAGMALYMNASGQLVAGSSAAAASAVAVGIALNGGASGQPIKYQIGGNINLGATLAVGKVYVVGTSGGIAPVDDIAGSEYVTVLGIATTAALLKMGIVVSGVAAAGAVS